MDGAVDKRSPPTSVTRVRFLCRHYQSNESNNHFICNKNHLVTVNVFSADALISDTLDIETNVAKSTNFSICLVHVSVRPVACQRMCWPRLLVHGLLMLVQLLATKAVMLQV